MHLPFGERPIYGSPEPEGIAVGFIDQDGDATGGDITFTYLADGGFLYRFEGLQVARGVAVGLTGSFLTSHRWATDKSGLGTSSFDLNHMLTYGLATGFAVYTPGNQRGSGGSSGGATPVPYMQLRRLPMGRTEDVALQVLLTITGAAWNVDTITHEAAIWLTYWRKESLYKPGFLQSFYEAPAIPNIPTRI